MNVTRQAELISLSRACVYYAPVPMSAADLSLMRKMGIEALYRRKNTSRRHPAHRIFPYLLCGLQIERPNQVWAADITYIPMARGFRQFLLRGLQNATGEWTLICTVHNLLKLAKAIGTTRS